MRVVTAVATAHLAALLSWIVVHATIGDHYWWSFLLDAFALYLFAPLLVTAPLALLLRTRLLGACVAACIALFLVFYGGLFVPPALRAGAPATAPRLTVMTFNVLVTNVHPAGVVDSVRRSGADVVGLQEVSPAVEEVLRHDLARLYPYQVFGRPTGASRLAILSRYPLHATGDVLPGEWTDVPLVARLDVAGVPVTVLNLHPVSTLLSATAMEREARQRAYTAHAIVDFVRAHPGPLIVLSDFNVGDQSTPYGIVSSVLGDSWREAGFGFGHTFPGAASPGSARLRLGGELVPMWLVRIDYVFHSRQWRAVDARIGPWDGVSDHRPVLATLALLDRTPAS